MESSNLIELSLTPKYSLAKSIKLLLIRRQASLAAIPLRSEPDEAAVGEVFGTFAVDIVPQLTRWMAMPIAANDRENDQFYIVLIDE